MSTEFLSFPPGVLGAPPQRLALLRRDHGWLAIEKPPGVGIHPHPLFPGVPVLSEALGGLSGSVLPGAGRLRPQAAFFTEPEIYGWALFSRDAGWLRSVRNDIGSSLAVFTFELLASDVAPTEGAERVCRLPLFERPAQSPPVVVSHRHGKKSATTFRRADSFPHLGLELWVARTTFPRPLQLRIHAFESGLRIPGDPWWEGGDPIWRQTFYRRRTGKLTPFFTGSPVWLRDVDFSAGQSARNGLLPSTITATPPNKWTEFLLKADRGRLGGSGPSPLPGIPRVKE